MFGWSCYRRFPLILPKTQCKIEFTYAPHCVSRNLTPHMILKKGSLIAQINRWNNNFQNMYYMLWAKVDRLAGKTYFVQKQHLKTPKLIDNFSDRLTLEGAGGQTHVTRSTFRPPPLKILGHNGLN